jgi:hypothetical protein
VGIDDVKVEILLWAYDNGAMSRGISEFRSTCSQTEVSRALEELKRSRYVKVDTYGGTKDRVSITNSGVSYLRSKSRR